MSERNTGSIYEIIGERGEMELNIKKNYSVIDSKRAKSIIAISLIDESKTKELIEILTDQDEVDNLSIYQGCQDWSLDRIEKMLDAGIISKEKYEKSKNALEEIYQVSEEDPAGSLNSEILEIDSEEYEE